MQSIEQLQRAICHTYAVPYAPMDMQLKLGISRNFLAGHIPLNGLRHPMHQDTSGWYLWAGETLSDAPDFFQPMHIAHLAISCPRVVGYLVLPPGWRFLLTDTTVDVWYDAALLHI